jgi:hypothetical protein
LETFATQFSKVSQASTKAAFETRFNAIQRGILKRQDKEIEKAVEDGTGQRIAALQKERDKLADTLPKVSEFQFALNSNANRFIDIAEASKAAAAVDSDLNDTLSADEVATLNAAKIEISENIRRLQTLYYPGFQDGNLVLRIRQDADRLDALTAVEGVIDPQGTDPATNANRELIDLLNEIQSRAVTFASSTNTLVESANALIIDIQKTVFDQEAKLAEITVLEIAKKTEEIDAIKERYAFLLKSISLSFEVQSGLADMLANGTQPAPEKGSILNLFT